jgi:hypothetical protein
VKPGIKNSIPKDERGAAMLAALCLAMVFALSLSSYIALCYTSLNMSTRNIAVSHSTELAETGIEQAIYALNNNDWTNWTLSGSTAQITMTMTSSGLVLTSTNPTPLNYGNGVNGQVQITVNNYTNFLNKLSPGPSISSNSTITLPAFMGTASTPTINGTASYSASISPTTAAVPLFVNAVAATSLPAASGTGTVQFTSGGTVDSYNSVQGATALVNGSVCQIISVGTTNWTLIGAASNTVGTFFTATGPGTGTGTAYVNYNNTAVTSTTYVNSGYSAVVLSQNTSTSSATVALGNAVVHGYAAGYNYSSPSSTNWFSYSSSGKIVGPSTPSTTNIDTSRLVTDPLPYQPVLPENLTAVAGAAIALPGASTTDGITLNKTSTLGSTTANVPVVYEAGGGISLTSNYVVTIQGPVVIICYSDVVINTTAQIQLTTPQASLEIFLEYGNLTLSGHGIVNTNAIPLPKKVMILSTNNRSGSATFHTAQPFYGVLYLPYMPISVTSVTPIIYGSIVGSSVTFTTNPTIHYDRALRSPMPSYTKTIPLQSGAAFDYLSSSAAFSRLATSVQ